eukprot:5469555-Pyramimonas_sp.AAC.1
MLEDCLQAEAGSVSQDAIVEVYHVDRAHLVRVVEMASDLVIARLFLGQEVQEGEVEVGKVAALELLAVGARQARKCVVQDVDAQLAQLPVRLRGDPVRSWRR